MMAMWERGVAASECERYGPLLLPPSQPSLDSLLSNKPPGATQKHTDLIVLCCSRGRKGQVESVESHWES